MLEPAQIEEPSAPADDWVLVKVDAAGICGSDIPRAFDGGAYHYPLVMGHEFAGTLVENTPLGDLGSGTRVAVFPLIPCYRCAACESLDYAQCVDYDYLGSRRDGAFAEYVRVPAANLFVVPDHVSQEEAAMTEPAAVALHGVRKVCVEPGATAVVYGGGPIGNLAAQWLRVRGCSRIMIVDINEQKLRLATDMGFTALNAADDPVAWCLSETGGLGADIAVEACGLPLTFVQTLQSAGRGGSVVFLGNINGTFRLEAEDFSSILRKELRIHGTWNSRVAPRGSDDWTVSLSAIGKTLDVSTLISHRVALDQGPAVFEGMRRGLEFYSKVVFLPQADA